MFRPATRATIIIDKDDGSEAAFDMLPSAFLGVSSGLPLAKALQTAIGSPTVSHSERINRSCDIPVEPASPDPSVGLLFVQTYLLKVHPKHPFLSPRRIMQWHDSIEGRASSTSTTFSASGSVSTKIEYFNLHLVYAIGARYMQLSQNRYTCNPETYYAAATQNIDCLFDSCSLESVEGMLLLAIFQLRSPSQPGIWSVIGMTMRHALSLGLHRRFQGPSVLDQRRRRLFWTIYMLERSIARTLGLPVCISDRDIDVPLPENVPDDIDDEEAMSLALQTYLGATAMSAAIHIFRLAQLESKIYSSMYRVDRPVVGAPSHKITRLQNLLDDWKAQIPSVVPNISDQEGASPNSYVNPQYHILHCHRIMLLLQLPRLTQMAPTDAEFQLCVFSAGQVAQLYKQLHDHQTTLSLSLIALHATFVAGLTLVYCFLASERTIFSPQFSSDIRACSTVLYVISESWPAAKKVRDSFERIVSLTIERENVSDSNNIAYDPTTYLYPLWQELNTQMPQQASTEQVDFLHTGFISDPSEFWNCFGGSWFGDEFNNEDFAN